VKKTILFFQVVLVCLLVGCKPAPNSGLLSDEIKYVDPFIGTGFHGPVPPARLRWYRSVRIRISWVGMPAAVTIMTTAKSMDSVIRTFPVPVSATWVMWLYCLSPEAIRSNRSDFSIKIPKKRLRVITPYVWITSV